MTVSARELARGAWSHTRDKSFEPGPLYGAVAKASKSNRYVNWRFVRAGCLAFALSLAVTLAGVVVAIVGQRAER